MTLKSAMASDMTTFFNTDEFADTATVDGVAVNVTFDNEADEAEQALLPVVRCDASLVPSLSASSVVIVKGKTYGVINWFDDNGVAVIALNEVQ